MKKTNVIHRHLKGLKRGVDRPGYLAGRRASLTNSIRESLLSPTLDNLLDAAIDLEGLGTVEGTVGAGHVWQGEADGWQLLQTSFTSFNWNVRIYTGLFHRGRLQRGFDFSVVSVLCCALADFAGKRRSWCTSVHTVFPALFGRAIIRRHHRFFRSPEYGRSLLVPCHSDERGYLRRLVRTDDAEQLYDWRGAVRSLVQAVRAVHGLPVRAVEEVADPTFRSPLPTARSVPRTVGRLEQRAGLRGRFGQGLRLSYGTQHRGADRPR